MVYTAQAGCRKQKGNRDRDTNLEITVARPNFRLRDACIAAAQRHHLLWQSFILILVSGVLLAGCASAISQKIRDADAPSAVEQGGYKIGVDDRVQVSVWRNPDLSVTVPVRPDGMISVPLIGDVQAGGKTTSELSAAVKAKLSLYIRDPSVTIIVTELHSHEYLSRVRVTGAVRTARSTQFRQGMTVVDAVLDAGGLNDFAAPNRAKLYRTADGKTKIYSIKLGDILNNGKLETNMKLFPGDVISIPERLF